jgi:hypothetical protein
MSDKSAVATVLFSALPQAERIFRGDDRNRTGAVAFSV